jgi:hypothetical protein
MVVVAAGYGVGAFGYRITRAGGKFAAEQVVDGWLRDEFIPRVA